MQETEQSHLQLQKMKQSGLEVLEEGHSYKFSKPALSDTLSVTSHPQSSITSLTRITSRVPSVQRLEPLGASHIQTVFGKMMHFFLIRVFLWLSSTSKATN